MYSELKEGIVRAREEKIMERDIEKKLVMKVKGMGGLALKLVSPSMNGLPDRLVLMEGKAFFVELKDTGKKPRPLQLLRIRQLRELGFKVYVVDNADMIDGVIADAIA